MGALSMVKGTVNSSVTLHRSLLEQIMRAPLSFFDTTPLGRIVNRFSKDIDTVDSAIPQAIDGWLICALQVVATLVLISVEVPIFMAVVVPILALYLFIQVQCILNRFLNSLNQAFCFRNFTLPRLVS